MAYVITQNCCKDASCVPVCPVDCIRPVGGAGEFTDTEMLYIDPEACIDCGACMDECPVGAVHYEDDLPESLARFKDVNAAYFERHPLEPDTSTPAPKHRPVTPGRLRIAVVGAGPAACYAASELIAVDGVEVDLFERLPTPYGLIRAGVAPDHQHTKSVVDVFQRAFASPRFGTHFNVEVGRDVSHDDLLAHHHAVIYAVGATRTRDLGIPGEDLPGSHAASDFVGWYNGHPEHAGHEFDLTGRRAVLIGNGNVAVDVARILLATPEHLAATDIARHALESLRHNQIDEVVIMGRRGLRHAAFSVGEFLALGNLDGVDIVIDGLIDGDDELDARPDDDVETTTKLDIAREYAARPITPGNKRIVFRFLASPSTSSANIASKVFTWSETARARAAVSCSEIRRPPPSSSRRVWSCARSAIAAPKSTAWHGIRLPGSFRMWLVGSSTRNACRFVGCTSPDGSNVGRAVSSAPTAPAPRRRSRPCSRTSTTACWTETSAAAKTCCAPWPTAAPNR